MADRGGCTLSGTQPGLNPPNLSLRPPAGQPVDRRQSLMCQLHATPADLCPGGLRNRVNLDKTRRPLDEACTSGLADQHRRRIAGELLDER